MALESWASAILGTQSDGTYKVRRCFRTQFAPDRRVRWGRGRCAAVVHASSVSNNAGYSNYNALQVRLARRATAGAHIIASYSFSHSFDNVSTDSIFTGIPGQFLNPRVDYGPSDFDVRHTATLGVDYNPKFGVTHTR